MTTLFKELISCVFLCTAFCVLTIKKRLGNCILSKFRNNIDVCFKRSFIYFTVLDKTSPPYNQGAFKLHIEFCPEFPFKPPKLLFKTPIYHPNIDEKGQICLPLIAPENWKPATTVPNIIQKLLAMLADPEIEHPLRADLAEEYAKDKNKFFKNAEEFTKKHAEKRS
ncbi:unnamed protein product [Schistocephalus solidus]|uniref:E2 ubiquitin-conjugating enzyme n=1 Tax=Schistocephalus solidus TaxID=70667 RepID=A0A183TP16_SCHSO|nr:unnamed protein product [Schistocephalus solidus]